MEKLKIPILSFIVTFSMLVQAQAQEIKAVLIDTLKFGNVKFWGTRQVQKDTAEMHANNMVYRALDDQFQVDTTTNAIQRRDVIRDDLPENLRPLRDQLVEEMKTLSLSNIDQGTFRRDGPYFEIMQRLVRDAIMNKGQRGLGINAPVKNGDYGSAKGKYNKAEWNKIRKTMIDEWVTSHTQLPKGRLTWVRWTVWFPVRYNNTGATYDNSVANGEITPEKAQGNVNTVDAHEKGHAFDLNHTFKGTTIPVEWLMKNGASYTWLNNYIASHGGEYMPPEQNAELVAFLLEQGVFKLDTLTSHNNEIYNQKFQLYPNPAYDIIHIRTMEDIKISSVIITDVTGRKVKEINLTSADNTGHDHIEIKDIRSEITPGMYILSISTSQGIVNKKVIIE